MEKIPIPSYIEPPMTINGSSTDASNITDWLAAATNYTHHEQSPPPSVAAIIELELCMSSNPMNKLSFAVTTLICFIVPLLLITVFYSMILGPIFKRRWLSAASPSEADRQLSRQRKMKAVKMVLVVIISFVVCWAPLYIATFATYFMDVKLHVVVTVVFQWFGSSNSCINPIIYAFLNDRYRKNFVNILQSR
jgi:hypothetical protein